MRVGSLPTILDGPGPCPVLSGRVVPQRMLPRRAAAGRGPPFLAGACACPRRRAIMVPSQPAPCVSEVMLMSTLCRACGAEVLAAAAFCHRCGQPITETAGVAAGSGPQETTGASMAAAMAPSPPAAEDDATATQRTLWEGGYSAKVAAGRLDHRRAGDHRGGHSRLPRSTRTRACSWACSPPHSALEASACTSCTAN